MVGWRALREKDNLNLQLKMVGCFLENGNFEQAEKKLAEVKEVLKIDDLFLSEQLKMYESRLRATEPQKREKEILFWKEKILANPSYPDAWVALSLLWRQEGDEHKAKLAMSKACRMDLIREDIKTVAQELNFSCP